MDGRAAQPVAGAVTHVEAAGEAHRALVCGVVRFSVDLHVAEDGTRTGASGLLDLSERRFAQITGFRGSDEDVETVAPQYFEDGVLSMSTTSGGGQWLRTSGCSVDDVGVAPLLWACGAEPGSGGAQEVALRRTSVLAASAEEPSLHELVRESVRVLGWEREESPVRARFARRGTGWWAQLHLPAGRGPEQAALVLTVDLAPAQPGVRVPRAPASGGGAPVMTPEEAVRLLAPDWPEDLPPWRPRTDPAG